MSVLTHLKEKLHHGHHQEGETAVDDAPVDATTLQEIKPCYATPSAGMHATHTLDVKLESIAAAGFKLVEVAWMDLEEYASVKYNPYAKIDHAGNGDVEKLVKAAEDIRLNCEKLGLSVLAVHPFSKFEGYGDNPKTAEGLVRARVWFKILKALNCQMLQVGSSDDAASSSDRDIIAADLRALADEAAAQQPPIRIAYEMWSWGTHVRSWEDTWDICQRVNRPNFGLCLDTFQISAIYVVDFLETTGFNMKKPPAPSLHSSLDNLTSTFMKNHEKIFYLQVSDGSDVSVTTLVKEAQKQNIHPLYVMSNSYRPLPPSVQPDFHGRMPVSDVVEAVLKTGWRGPMSYEVFYAEDMQKQDAEVPKRWSSAAMDYHLSLLKSFAKA